MLKSMRNCVQVLLLDWRTDKANDNFKKDKSYEEVYYAYDFERYLPRG